MARVLVDDRQKLERIVLRLKLAGNTRDWCDIDEKGQPKSIKYLETVRYGINGLTFDQVALLLEDIKDGK